MSACHEKDVPMVEIRGEVTGISDNSIICSVSVSDDTAGSGSCPLIMEQKGHDTDQSAHATNTPSRVKTRGELWGD